MGISMSSIASTIGRMVVENQIASDDVNKTLARAAHLQAQEQINTKTALKEAANGLKSAMSYVQIAQSAVKAGTAVVGAAQAVGNVGSQMQQRDQVASQVDSARGGAGGSYPTGHDDGVASMRIGETTIGDRFNADQRAALFSGEPLPSHGRLVEMGFTSREATELGLRAGPDGRLSMDHAVVFTQEHMPTQAQLNEHRQNGTSFESMQDREKAKQAFKDKAIEQGVALLNNGLSYSAKRKSEEAKKAGELTKFLNEIGNGLTDAAVSHNKAIGEIELKAIKDNSSENPFGSKKKG